jgi:hypothetical protein
MFRHPNAILRGLLVPFLSYSSFSPGKFGYRSPFTVTMKGAWYPNFPGLKLEQLKKGTSNPLRMAFGCRNMSGI